MGVKAVLKRTIWLVAQVPPLGRAVVGYYERKPSDWNREHPYDKLHGVHTSGMVPGVVLTSGGSDYAAAQPSIIRRALGALPDPWQCHFLDLGCGKGRPLLVATEFGFPAITGIELSPTLSGIARRNAAVFARAYPDRIRIDIVTDNALAHKLPETKLVVFLYNPFNRLLMAKLLNQIEVSLRANYRDLYIVYYNPTWADVLDASTALERRYAAQLLYEPGEVGYGPDASDAVVIWQNRGNPHPRPPGDPAVPVTIVAPGRRAEIRTQSGLKT
jgi:SAM-dependent methyltransferase